MMFNYGYEDDDSMWLTDDNNEDLSSLSSVENLSQEGTEDHEENIQNLDFFNSWTMIDSSDKGYDYWRKRNSYGDVPITSRQNIEFDDAPTSKHFVETRFPRLSNVTRYESEPLSTSLNRKNSDSLIGDAGRQMYLTKLRQNADKTSSHKYQGINSSLPRSILPDRPVLSNSTFNQDGKMFIKESKSKHQSAGVVQSPIPLKATIHRSSSGRNRVAHFFISDDVPDDVRAVRISGAKKTYQSFTPLENDIETLDLEDSDEVDVSVAASVVDAVVSLSAKGVRSAVSPKNKHATRPVTSSCDDLTSSVHDVEQSNPFGRKPVLVKSPSLSKLKQRSETKIYDMGNNSSQNVDGSIYGENKEFLTDNSRRINVVGRSSGTNGLTSSKNGLDSSQSSGKSIISVSHAGSPTTYTDDDSSNGRHLPEVKVERQNRSKYASNNNSLIKISKSTPTLTPSNIVKSQQRYHPPHDSYEDDFESSSSSSAEERLQDPMSFSISKITRDKLLLKQGQLMREAEQRRAALRNTNNMKTQSQPNPSSRHGPPNNVSSHHNKNNTVPNRSHVSRRNAPTQSSRVAPPARSRSLAPSNKFRSQPNRSHSKDRRSEGFESRGRDSHRMLSDSSAGFSLDKVRVMPLNNPTESLKTALRSLTSDNWTIKIDGLQTLLCLSSYHHNVMIPELHSIILALIAEVKNLRSSVSRLAINCVGDMFIHLKKNMDQDLELVARTLFHKSGENSGFIRDDVEKALMHMVTHVSPNKAVFVVVVAGASHRNSAVRKMAALCLMKLVEKLGVNKILGGPKDYSEKVLPTAAQFLVDGNPMTRYYGKKMVYILMDHHNFERCLHKYVQPSTLRNINNALESLRNKGVGECPLEATSSAKSRLHDLSSRGSNLSKTM